jgi:hypothetical protein
MFACDVTWLQPSPQSKIRRLNTPSVNKVNSDLQVSFETLQMYFKYTPFLCKSCANKKAAMILYS